MKIYNLLIDQSLEQNKSAFRMLKFTIFIAVLSLTIFVLLLSSFIKNKQNITNTIYGNHHIHISQESLTEDQINLLKNNVHIEDMAYKGQAKNETLPSIEKTLNIYPADQLYLDYIGRSLKLGELPKASNELLLPHGLAKDFDIQPGDEVQTLDTDGNPKAYIVSGFYYSDPLSWEDNIPVYICTDYENMTGGIDDLLIWYKDIKESYKLTPDIYELLGLDYEQALESDKFPYNMEYLSSHFVSSEGIIQDNSKYYPKIFAIGSIAILIFFILIIKNVLSVWENSQIREYGLLMTIGASKRDIYRLIFKRLFKVALIPFILGIIVALGLDLFILHILNKLFALAQQNAAKEFQFHLNFYLHPIAIPFIPIFTALVLGISSLTSIRKISKMNIIDTLKTQISTTSIKKPMTLKPKSFLKDLSHIFLNTHKKPLTISIISIGISCFFLAMTLSLYSGLNLDMRLNHIDEFIHYDYVINYSNPELFPRETLAKMTNNYEEDYLSIRKFSAYLLKSNDYHEIMTEEGFERIYPDYQASLNMEEAEIPVTLIGVDDQNFGKLINKLGYDPDAFNANSAILINQLAENPKAAMADYKLNPILKDDIGGLRIGVYHSNAQIEEKNKEIPLEIKGATDKIDLLKVPVDPSTLNILISMSDYLNLVGDSALLNTDFLTESIYLTQNNFDSIDTIEKVLKDNEVLTDYEIYSKGTKEASSVYSYMMLYFLLAIISLIALFVGLAHSYASTNNLRLARKKDYAELMIVGLDREALKKLVLKEANLNMLIILISTIILTLLASFIASTGYKEFSFIRILLNMKFYLIIIYLVVIYLIIRHNYLRIIEHLDLRINSKLT